MKARRKAREAALRILYMMDVGGLDIETAERGYWAHFAEEEDAPARPFGERLVRGYAGRAHEVDETIRAASHHWRLERMARVDRNILRLGLTELLEGETPERVVLNEAVELAKRYGAEGSAGFVNGILDQCATRLRRRSASER